MQCKNRYFSTKIWTVANNCPILSASRQKVYLRYSSSLWTCGAFTNDLWFSRAATSKKPANWRTAYSISLPWSLHADEWHPWPYFSSWKCSILSAVSTRKVRRTQRIWFRPIKRHIWKLVTYNNSQTPACTLFHKRKPQKYYVTWVPTCTLLQTRHIHPVNCSCLTKWCTLISNVILITTSMCDNYIDQTVL